MLVLRLDARDLSRITFSAAEHAETIGALQSLRAPSDSGFHTAWQRRTVPMVSPAVAALLRAVPPEGEVPDDLTPESLTARPTPQVVQEMTRLEPAAATRWTRLGPALVDFHRTAIQPHRHTMRRLLLAELATCAHTLQRSGLDAALSRLGDHVHWRPPYLHVDAPRDEVVDNAGRGLRLVPSVFWRRPGVVLEGYAVPTIVYPLATADIDRLEASEGPDLAALLGPTRARVLAALLVPMSTSELAEELGTSLANASTHVAVLRRNGLVGSRRAGRRVEHVTLPLGHRVLRPFG